MHEGADREREVVLVEAGEGVTEIDRQPGGQAGCEAEDPAFPAGAGQGAGVEGGGGGGPVDCGVRSSGRGSFSNRCKTAAGERRAGRSASSSGHAVDYPLKRREPTSISSAMVTMPVKMWARSRDRALRWSPAGWRARRRELYQAKIATSPKNTAS